MSDIYSYLSARRKERYRYAIAIQGNGFTALRTPAEALARDGRGLLILPPAQLFDSPRESFTARILAGDQDARAEALMEVRPELLTGVPR